MSESILPLLTFLKPVVPYLSITFAIWLTYFYTLRCGFVSDDHAGMGEYDGKLQGWEYGMLWRWGRYHICGGNSPSRHKRKFPDGKEFVIPQGKVPARHHFLAIVVFNITCLVAYKMLLPILGAKLAFLSILILVVHPCSTQGVAWISGIAYPLSLLWISLMIMLTRWLYLDPSLNHAIIAIPIFCILHFLAIHAIFATTATMCAVLWFLGYRQMAVLSFLVSGAMCFDIIRQTINLRVEEFKKQHMEQSTVFKWRKFIVAMKTLWYYLCHAVLPINMGLYHVWGFHYDREMELTDYRFWLGLISFFTLGGIFFLTGSIAIKLGILWFVIFSIGFWNWITAQQFVTERYIMVANLGLGMVIASLTQNYLWIYTFIFGAYLVRTWMHLPTYDNELRFYQSNCWNFQKSEVALGNLGVTYLKMGLEGTAKEHWLMATGINQDYDVPWVNIFYQYRTQGNTLFNNGDYLGGFNKFKEGLPFLEKALICKICHYPEQWKQEYAQLVNNIRNPQVFFNEELKRLLRLKEDLRNMLSKATTTERMKEIETSVDHNEKQMTMLINFMKANSILFVDPAVYNKFSTDRVVEKLTRR